MTTQELTYQHDTITFRAFCAFPENLREKTPAVLIAPAWAGRDKFACDQAERMTELGYIGIALDVYGEAKLGSNKEENMQLVMPLFENRSLLLQRLKAGLDAVCQMSNVDNDRIALVGFCFGGLCGLDMARAGCHLKGVVSFHGNLTKPDWSADANIATKLLVLHGYDDPSVPPEKVCEFMDEMTQCQADWQLHAFSQTKHAFTNPEADDPSIGNAYNALSAERGWLIAFDFLSECFE
ncbi:MAG: dienelactone hydrolase family protein [Pseudomonadota bacterium]